MAELSDYEQQRLARIEQNRAMMAALGLVQADVDLAAEMRRTAGGSAGPAKQSRKRKSDTPVAEADQESAPVPGEFLADDSLLRRSRRHRRQPSTAENGGDATEGNPSSDNDEGLSDSELEQRHREAQAAYERCVRLYDNWVVV